MCAVLVLIPDSRYCKDKNCRDECSNLFISNRALCFICMHVQNYNVSILADSRSEGGALTPQHANNSVSKRRCECVCAVHVCVMLCYV